MTERENAIYGMSILFAAALCIGLGIGISWDKRPEPIKPVTEMTVKHEWPPIQTPVCPEVGDISAETEARLPKSLQAFLDRNEANRALPRFGRQ